MLSIGKHHSPLLASVHFVELCQPKQEPYFQRHACFMQCGLPLSSLSCICFFYCVQGLHSRLKDIHEYLELVAVGKLPVNHGIMYTLQVQSPAHPALDHLLSSVVIPGGGYAVHPLESCCFCGAHRPHTPHHTCTYPHTAAAAATQRIRTAPF